MELVSLTLLGWIVIYPMEGATWCLNDQGQEKQIYIWNPMITSLIK